MQSLFGDFDVLFLEAVLFGLLWYQISLRNLHLLFFRITRHLYDFHSVEKWSGNGVCGIGCGNEHHLGQIKRNLQEMVCKGIVLLWIQDF